MTGSLTTGSRSPVATSTGRVRLYPIRMQHSADENAVTVAIPDQFAPELVNILMATVPPHWTINRAVDYQPANQLASVAGADVIFAMWAPITVEMLHTSDHLRLVQKLGAGVDRIDLDFCRQNEIAVARLAGINAVPVAEHVVMFILAGLRRLKLSQSLMRQGKWFKEEARAFQRELRNKTVGLVGVGYVGREVARRLAPFGAELIYHDLIRLPSAVEAEFGLRYEGLDELVASADVVSLHVPLTPDTHHLLNETRIRAMKPQAIVVNCARGGLIDEAALGQALDEGRLGGAALDTFAEEPLVDFDLVRKDSVISTPHSAGATRDNFELVIQRAVENTINYLGGHGLPEADVAYAPSPTSPP